MPSHMEDVGIIWILMIVVGIGIWLLVGAQDNPKAEPKRKASAKATAESRPERKTAAKKSAKKAARASGVKRSR